MVIAMRTLAEDDNDRRWSDLVQAVNTADDAAYRLTAALRYPSCKERDEAISYAADQLDACVQETKDLFNKLFRAEREEVVPLEEDDWKMKVVG
jgi:hypothetical protein